MFSTDRSKTVPLLYFFFVGHCGFILSLWPLPSGTFRALGRLCFPIVTFSGHLCIFGGVGLNNNVLFNSKPFFLFNVGQERVLCSIS